MDRFHQGLADALGSSTMGLSVQDHRVDRAADIVDRRVADDLDRAGLAIDLDLADMRAVGKAADIEYLLVGGRKRPAQRLGQILGIARGSRDLEYTERSVGSLHGEAPGREFEIVFRRFHDMGSDPASLSDDVIGGSAHENAGEAHRPSRIRAAADGYEIGVARDQLDALEGHAEPVGQRLREAGS